MYRFHSKIKVGITMGDPSGIGPAVIANAIPRLCDLADFVIIGDRWVFDKNQKSKIKNQNFRFVDLNNVAHKNFEFGKIKSKYGKASIEYLDKALDLIKDKQIDCLVTSPISKEAVNLAGFKGFRGHTEYLAEHTGTKDTVMMLLNKKLKFSLITSHVSIKDIPLSLKREKIYNTILLTHKSLRELFLIRDPHIVVSGLNPHASDNGLLGDEENRIIKPVLKNLRKRISHIYGPLSADVAISKAYDGAYDCVIAMYHDQAMIPLKILGNKTGANLTLGLPFIRTSPLHGTAFDIAKTPNLIDSSSFIEAIKVALKCVSNLRKA